MASALARMGLSSPRSIERLEDSTDLPVDADAGGEEQHTNLIGLVAAKTAKIQGQCRGRRYRVS